jgi:hypothetical protein
MSKCGECVFGATLPSYLTKRICRGIPPQIVALPVPQGVQLQNMYPLVNASDDGCGLHKQKPVVDNADQTALEL